MSMNCKGNSCWDFINTWNIGENQTYPYLYSFRMGIIDHRRINPLSSRLRRACPPQVCGLKRDDSGFAFGDGVEEVLAVAFVDDAGIEDNYDSGIGLAADQPPEALLEFDDCRGKLIVEERVAALLLYLLQPAGQQWLIGHGEWQTNDNDVAEGLAPDVNTLPKAVGAEQYAAVLGSAEGLEAFQEGASIQLFALLQQLNAVVGAPIGHPLGHIFEHLVAGKEGEGPALSLEYVFLHRVACGFDEGRLIRTGQALFDVEGDIALVVVGRAEL